MDSKKIVIIGVLVLIVVAVILVMFTTSQSSYETTNITPNGTSIEIPNSQMEYSGEYEGVKIWYWDNGLLVTYNNHEGSGVIQLIGLSFNTLNELVKYGEMQNMDGFTWYVINASDLNIHLSDIVNTNFTGKFYCIPLTNGDTQDNIIIFCNDKDTALNMAKSVQYKKVYQDDVGMDEVISTVENLTGNSSNTNASTNNTTSGGVQLVLY